MLSFKILEFRAPQPKDLAMVRCAGLCSVTAWDSMICFQAAASEHWLNDTVLMGPKQSTGVREGGMALAGVK